MGGKLVGMVKAAFEKWQRDDCGTIAASLAYFALFSLFPLILVILSVVGFVIDPSKFEVRRQLVDLIGSAQVRDLVAQTLEHLSENRAATGLIGFATLLLAASGIFGALDKAFDVIWDVDTLNQPKPAGIVAAARSFLRDKLVAFGLVLGCALLILLSVLSSVAVTAVSAYTSWLPGQELLLQAAQLTIAGLLLTLALTAIYKVLPNRPVRWGDVWPAALVAAVLFAALQRLAGVILGMTNYATYGAVGGVMTLMVYIYLSFMVLLLGGELSYAYARSFGSLSGEPGRGEAGDTRQGPQGERRVGRRA